MHFVHILGKICNIGVSDQHNHPQPPLLRIANHVQALLGSCRNLSWWEFQSLAPNLAKDL